MNKTFAYRNGKVVQISRENRQVAAPAVWDDITPYHSMIDGSMVSSRSRHREHLRDNNCIEVGNEVQKNTRKPTNNDSRRRILTQQLESMTHKQANKILQELRESARFTRPHRERE